MENTNFLSLKNVEKIYPNGAKAVYDFNLDIEKNEFIVIVGPSGCGKTTTLRMIAGLEDISDGEIYLNGELLNYKPSKDRNMAIVFQSYALYPQMNVYDNIAFPLTINKYPFPVVNQMARAISEIKALLNAHGVANIKEFINSYQKAKNLSQDEYVADGLNIHITSSGLLLKLIKNSETIFEELEKLSIENDSYLKEHNIILNDKFEQLDADGNVVIEYRKMTNHEIKEKVYQTAEILDLGHYLDRIPKELSGGQMQRVALGRAIVKNVPVFLMDEPLSNLDAKLRLSMRSEIVKLHNSINATTIYVTHDQTEAMTMATRIVVMSRGFVQQIGTPEVIYNEPNNLFVAKFIGSPSINLFTAKYHHNGSLYISDTLKVKASSKLKKAHEVFYDRKMKEFLTIMQDFVNPETRKAASEAILKIQSALVSSKVNKPLTKTKTLYDKVKSLFRKKEEVVEDEIHEQLVCKEKIQAIQDALENDHDVIVAIRPEKMNVRIYQGEELKANEVKVYVTVSELLGDEYNVHFTFNNHDVVCKFDVTRKIKTGDVLVMSFDIANAQIFDPISGERIKL